MKLSTLLWAFLLFNIVALGGSFLPWYALGIVAFFLGLFLFKKNYHAFFIPLVFCASLWMTYAFYFDYRANVSIAGIISALFNDTGKLPIYVITGLVIGLFGGIAGLSGNYLSKFMVDLIYKGIIKI